MRKPISTVKPYVVHVTFPNGGKEYSYGCDLPNVHRGSILLINNASCLVQSVEHRDPGNLKWVPGSLAVKRYDRYVEIAKRLRAIEEEEGLLARWSKLKSPEAKKLVAELRKLNS